jgi:hypothetical protein
MVRGARDDEQNIKVRQQGPHHVSNAFFAGNSHSIDPKSPNEDRLRA